MIRWLAVLACALTVCITASSAFIRHSQAGLGCGGDAACVRAAKAGAAGDAAAADAVTPGVRTARALHRVSASAVGVLVLLLAAFGWSSMRTSARVALGFALADTLFLAWLGRFTPHPVPLVTVGNLVGGIALAAAFAWIAASSRPRHHRHHRSTGVPFAARALPLGALALLAVAAWLGTMIGAHDAIGACGGVGCAGPARLDVGALDPLRAAGAIDAAAARGLHWLHRGVAVAFAIAALLVAVRARGRGAAFAVVFLVMLLVLQIATGAATTARLTPLASATLHNAFAALLAVTLAAIAARARSRLTVREPGGARGDAESFGGARHHVDANPAVRER